jgi:hypothetical protein
MAGEGKGIPGDKNVGKHKDLTVDTTGREEAQATDRFRQVVENHNKGVAGAPVERQTRADAGDTGKPMTVADAHAAIDSIAAALMKVSEKLGPEGTKLLTANLQNGEYNHDQFPLGKVMEQAFKVTPQNEHAMRTAVMAQLAELNKDKA